MFPKSLAVFPLPRNDLQSVINHKQAGQSQSRVEGGWRAHRPPRPIAPQQVARGKGPARPGPSGRTVFHPRYLGGRRHGDSGVTARVVTLVSHSCHTRVTLVSHSSHGPSTKGRKAALSHARVPTHTITLLVPKGRHRPWGTGHRQPCLHTDIRSHDNVAAPRRLAARGCVVNSSSPFQDT